jgi:hypothetical protein
MKYLAKLWAAFFGNDPDQYIPIETRAMDEAPKEPSPKVMQVARTLFNSQEVNRLVAMAIKAHPEEVNQIKWLQAIPVLRTSSKKRWILDEPVLRPAVPVY